MSMPGPYELIIILIIILLLFGGRKIPEIARGIGRGLREFRKARDEVMDAVDEDNHEGKTKGDTESDKEFTASKADESKGDEEKDGRDEPNKTA